MSRVDDDGGGLAQQRFDLFGVRDDAVVFFRGFAEGVGVAGREAFEEDVDRGAEQDDVVEPRIEVLLVPDGSGDEERLSGVLVFGDEGVDTGGNPKAFPVFGFGDPVAGVGVDAAEALACQGVQAVDLPVPDMPVTRITVTLGSLWVGGNELEPKIDTISRE
ncbi:hypothetical protein BS329_02090 [Amycolatopsis coloradensis]|uniref:Uncharacterized protein n=1 Tax=Amycolatopsis coloradensis TaxID=76021 RepID=A0A1R0L251_9PSEU|nr:hypothetical protein [Amycolatopsis coloradensis]OLZ56447.1 hypothetical protein BS329_02090 [Amycolatopsis coloradensis]